MKKTATRTNELEQNESVEFGRRGDWGDGDEKNVIAVRHRRKVQFINVKDCS